MFNFHKFTYKLFIFSKGFIFNVQIHRLVYISVSYCQRSLRSTFI